PPPGVDARVVARQQYVGHGPATEVGGTRVVRILEAPAELGRKALELAGTLGQRARQPARNGVEQDHGRQVAVLEYVRPDRDRIRREVLDDPLVEALE